MPRLPSFFTLKSILCARSNSNYISKMSDKMIWVDLEMTGLDINKCTILEMACIVTDGNLKVIAEGPDVCVHHPESVLTSMEEWSQDHHEKTGLIKSCRESRYSMRDVEIMMLDFVKEHTSQGSCPLAGNSIYCDKMFLIKYMPEFTSYLHYRIVDVSSIKELCRRWYVKDYDLAPKKQNSHRALEDIKESIEELKYYKNKIFK
ncbi:PREDICTED: oligoribonuclease, mitochondrial-like [Amphimedon queenslandica]|uniref:Exonuclease domain-containing protein n=2 Tax=Amphimedon queenslandica TaxID=400682 RepID=A0AAN0IFJ2_AMPQE|nr:PREDICTED: oligoribonuclease, mitochondrial-like [Amphimedon queenslandica]|eukprot:XP_003387775.2 PREDICTED: oligoribonuclease, mitochondrial-like [Amphimedon queenslandica]